MIKRKGPAIVSSTNELVKTFSYKSEADFILNPISYTQIRGNFSLAQTSLMVAIIGQLQDRIKEQVSIGEMRKYSVEATKLIPTIMARFFRDCFKRSSSKVPTAKPKPLIGPIKGEMSMAPMMTAVALTLSPTEAMMIAKKRIQTFTPLTTLVQVKQ